MSGVVRFFSAFGEVMALMGQTLAALVHPPFEFRLTVEQLERGGVDSTSITLLTAVFTGMVTASQFERHARERPHIGWCTVLST